ncbi:MAG TPA: DNA polymerase III subunit delta' [Alphaproteobacteria bacterium]|nr:DNA polymerase III subunit delta' [Alphaproteobacteria bacterium]
MSEPAQTSALIGHDEAMKQAAEAFASGRMHHAWMIAGIEGIGKSTLAYHIAQHVLSGGENKIGKLDMNHRVAKLITAEAHPDMLVIRRATDEKTGELRNSIVVDDALKVAAFLHKTSTHGGWRVVMIDEAQTLNRHGQNAILKILEEPPARVLILITVTTPGALLPTIRSRCRVLHLAPLDTKHLKTILTRSGPELAQDDVERLIALSGGSVGFALKILRTETLPLYDELLSILSDLPKLDIARLHKLADSVSRKADAEGFDVLRTLLIEAMRVEARDQAVSGAGGVAPKLQAWDKVRGIFAAAEGANLDRKLAFINAVTEIRNAA